MGWDIVYYREPDGSVPTEEFLDECPDGVEADLLAIVDAVADGPPPQFRGGGMWEAMHGEMGGYYEVRTAGPGREQFRLFCVLDRADDAELAKRGLPGPAIAVITGMRKRSGEKFTKGDYRAVRALGGDYKATLPRPIATDRRD